ncbi:MAG: acyl-CoA dehydrogenase family protein [Gammaproteobacteria bacterium]|nr:acyl-CoA dehydrogenase family protein [Gammaproteobacteria bacterium]
MTESAEMDDFTEAHSRGPGQLPASLNAMEGASDGKYAADMELWRQRLAEQGWGAPTWPTEYGGAGLDHARARVVAQEMGRIGAVNPIPTLAGMGVTMVGPTILEYGTEDQKARHLPGIASGAVRWCLGLSEPNAGSDLASLSDPGRWMRAITSSSTARRPGPPAPTSPSRAAPWRVISTTAGAPSTRASASSCCPWTSPAWTTRPIRLISGASPFCETFFTDARAEKERPGWVSSTTAGSAIKRLLQHERASQTSAAGPAASAPSLTPGHRPSQYVGVDAAGRLDDPDLRGRLTTHLMDAAAHKLTAERITAEAKGNVQVGAAASIMKNSAILGQPRTRAELLLEIMGHQRARLGGRRPHRRGAERYPGVALGQGDLDLRRSRRGPEEHHLQEHPRSARDHPERLTRSKDKTRWLH